MNAILNRRYQAIGISVLIALAIVVMALMSVRLGHPGATHFYGKQP